MNIITSDSDDTVKLDVVLSETTIKVLKGTYQDKSVDYELVDDEEFDLQTRIVTTAVIGYLVRNKGDGESRILVHEDVQGKNLIFRETDHPDWVIVRKVFSLHIPKNAAPIDGQLKVLHIAPQSKEGS